ncbi:MAG: general secretion pathway protein GspK [Desulfobacula sp.]
MLKNEKGMALVVTLAVVAVLLAAGLWLAKFTGNAAMVTLAEKDRFQAEQLAISGIEIAKLLLIEDTVANTTDSVQELWADPEQLSKIITVLGIEKGTLTLTITDELSKIQMNALVKQFPGSEANPDQVKLWEHFLSDEKKDDIKPEEKINAVKDWLDSEDDDAVTGLSGAETDYYKGLTPPYACANGPFNHVEELLNVKGFSGYQPQKSMDSLPGESIEKIGLEDIFTVWGLENNPGVEAGYGYPGLININTAGIEILWALLPEGMESLAKDLVDFRKEKNQDKTGYINVLDQGWYKKVIELPAKEQAQMDRMVRYSSNIFKIESRARKNSSSITFHAFLVREKNGISGKWTCRTLQMERE